MALPFATKAPLLGELPENTQPVEKLVPTPVSIKWEDVNVSIRSGAYWGDTPMSFNGNERQTLINSAFGYAASGQITALLGPEAGGKSLLLKVLAGRLENVKYPEIRGGIFFEAGGVRIRQQSVDMTELAGFVEKTDFHYAWITVRETLSFTAKLRLSHLSYAAQSAKVDSVMELLGIEHTKDKKIGSDLPVHRDLTAGDRKLATLGCELLHSPTLLFLDEPTRELDSFQALQVIEVLRKLASKGYTVVTALRQPRADLFDRLVLMSGGWTAYSGPAGDAAADFFTKAGAPLPPGHIRADHYMAHITLDTRSPAHVEKSKAKMKALIGQCRFMHDQARGKAELPLQSMNEDTALGLIRMEQLHPFVSFRVCCLRQWREVYRDRWTQFLKIFFSLLFGFAFGVLYWQTPFTQKSLRERCNLLLFMALKHNLFATIHVGQNMPRQVQVVNRDRTHKLYGAWAFYFSHLLVAWPFEIIPLVLDATIVYFMANLRRGLDHFFIYVSLLFLINLCGTAVGTLQAVCSKPKAANPAMAPLMIFFMFAFSGWYITILSLPAVARWISAISWVRYGFEGLAKNELAGVPKYPGELYPGAVFNGTTITYGFTGDQFLTGIDFHEDGLWGVVWRLLLETAVFHAIAFLVLLAKRPDYAKCKEPPSNVDREKAARQQSQDEAMAAGLFANAMVAQPVAAREALQPTAASRTSSQAASSLAPSSVQSSQGQSSVATSQVLQQSPNLSLQPTTEKYKNPYV